MSPSSSPACWPRWHGDTALADAARGRDLYAGIVDSGAVATRSEAKIAILGAMYGATTGDSGRLVPRLRRTYPRAMGLVDDAARIGEDGGVVSTWLGRTSPGPSEGWAVAQSRATEAEASRAPTRPGRAAGHAIAAGSRATSSCRARPQSGRSPGWPICGRAWPRCRRSRQRMRADRSGPVFARHPHLAFFLHDEVIVHAPAAYAETGRTGSAWMPRQPPRGCSSATSRSTSRSTCASRESALKV